MLRALSASCAPSLTFTSRTGTNQARPRSTWSAANADVDRRFATRGTPPAYPLTTDGRNRRSDKEEPMSQVNVNSPEPVDTVDTSGDRTAAAGINMITVLIVLAVLAVIAWYLFTGPLRSMSGAGGTTNINVNQPPAAPTTVNINPPAQPQAPAPAGGNTGTGTGNTPPGGGTNPPPANP